MIARLLLHVYYYFVRTFNLRNKISFKFDELIVRGVLLLFRLDMGLLSWFYGKVLGENLVYIEKESGRKFRYRINENKK